MYPDYPLCSDFLVYFIKADHSTFHEREKKNSFKRNL